MSFKAGYISILLLAAVPVCAETVMDLGVVGEVYPVVEPDVREMVKKQIAENWEVLSHDYQNKARTYKPSNLHLLPKAANDRSFTVDMSYTLDRDLRDKEGRVVYPKGYTFNPLDYVGLNIGLVVIDGDDPSQVQWFKRSPYYRNKRIKLLLSGGSAYDMVRELDRAVFYLDDLTAERFRLTAVPCVVVKRNRTMLVTEFLIVEGDDAG